MRKMMMEYMKLKTDDVDIIGSDMKELSVASARLMSDVAMLSGFGFSTSFLRWIASFAAIYLLILDRTKSRAKTLLLVPYIFFSLPSVIFNFFSGEVGKWIAFVAVVPRLCFNKRFPAWLEMLGALVVLLVVAPSFFADTLRDKWIDFGICLIIGCYLLQEHIRASGGFRVFFTQPHGISNTVAIILLLVYPVRFYYYPTPTMYNNDMHMAYIH